ncbi:capsid protein [Agrobacterium phage OLIVR2]|uniref:Capsid protein n=1 Tax=Agrobacterium phage OLIVR1 TaxID=2723769 RepID=A0A858MR85_9CAUD|nr:N4-gp56 family major capsid protein [Xanthomonas campestris]YP_010107126.1 major head protein [Agrobacterium phage OLIVR1]QIW87394.1 capsid protein [Agrobacterium phage OLIVR2]QIW87501.1 capsid protein [Agrobacterium phage OLIVR3]MCF8861592.1 N4-gp56 family major capsid protein [Xanthomonas campestris pv. campestris]QIW87287.1 capsid protein [Agrobacterium phage OLIVR1]
MLNYNAPIDGVKSTIDGDGSDQMNTFLYLKGAIIEARKDQYFMPLASAINMPKNYGKTVKVYEYVPLLDDRNINDQGIDANGVTIANGNLYGSSRDIGTIVGKLPTLTENGGRVNRVGFTRLMREGSIHKFGFFTEFTQESLDFDSDDELMKHLSRELMNGAVQLTEAVLQKDLLAGAGTILYSGAATSDDEITGEEEVVGGATVPASVVSYKNLMRLDKILNDNRTPKQTKIISGSRLIDTKTIAGGRVAYHSSDLSIVLRGMTDLFGNPAFIPVQHYADAGTLLNGEIGSVGAFRFIEVPEMLHWAGAGAEVDDNPGYQSTVVGGVERYDVFPIFVVGSEAFSTIGFQTDGKTLKFTVMTKMPGRETADRNDPYGETGFSSIKWYYGILIKRPERLAIIKTVAPI